MIAGNFRLAAFGAAAAGLMALSSCATLNEQQCATVSWVQLGQEDGAAGRPASYVQQHEQACSKHKLPVNRAEWQTGWDVGIRAYCTPANGLSEGREGRYYANSCPADLAADFQTAYHIGKRLYDARTERTRVQNELDALLVKLKDAKKREEQDALRLEIDLKRSSLYSADSRVRDAERALDFYILSSNLPRG
ncbi:hypothetical protein MAXJ12_12297 [Mesorhizobium alhagi CCNWXJ12-2]|jgi:hypothetical protein|uniref:DUF2799 domain-containing protein n=2 Tax=Allomesorhizobium alhagi TaxID=475067 RepID=H0HQM9_9HYPH|nr:hypothetical protein MAXJ12_12297 [Mesorhizobium alhagi CCNWXJ12-2]